MFIKQADLFWGLSKSFLKEVMDIAHKENLQKNEILFHEEDPADSFFMLLKGRIRLTIDATGQIDYNFSKPGDTFGWSSLTGNNRYTASAECTEPVTLLRFSGNDLQKIINNYPTDGLVFYKRLAGMIGNRLIQSYRMNSDVSLQGKALSFGTGQVIASESAV